MQIPAVRVVTQKVHYTDLHRDMVELSQQIRRWVMTIQELLEKDKERFLQTIVKVPDAKTAGEETARELSRILYEFNEQENSESVKAAAYQMIEALKSAAELVDSAGVTKIYGRKEYGTQQEKPKRSSWFYIYLVIGLGCTIASALICILNGNILQSLLSIPVVMILYAAGIITMFLAGTQMHAKPKSEDELYGETTVDGNKIWHTLLVTAVKIDKILEDIRTEETLAKKQELHESDGGMKKADIELFAQLLEDAYADKDNDTSREMISHIRFYLHQKMITLVDYTPKDQAYFDMMPAKESSTIRPAIVLDGRLLKKGLAAGGR